MKRYLLIQIHACNQCEKSFGTKKALYQRKKKKKLKVKRKLSMDGHLKKALSSHISFNSLRVRSPNRVMTLRRNTPTQSPLLN